MKLESKSRFVIKKLSQSKRKVFVTNIPSQEFVFSIEFSLFSSVFVANKAHAIPFFTFSAKPFAFYDFFTQKTGKQKNSFLLNRISEPKWGQKASGFWHWWRIRDATKCFELFPGETVGGIARKMKKIVKFIQNGSNIPQQSPPQSPKIYRFLCRFKAVSEAKEESADLEMSFHDFSKQISSDRLHPHPTNGASKMLFFTFW